MKAQELRIGNYIMIKYYDSDSDSFKNFETSVDIEHLQDALRYGDKWEAEPIKITPEFLDDLGFTRYNSMFDAPKTGKSYGYQKLRLQWKQHYINWDVVKPANRKVELNYVHELQNLYFALTGEELKVKQLTK